MKHWTLAGFLLVFQLGLTASASSASAMGFKPGSVPRDEAILIAYIEPAKVRVVSVFVTDPTADDSHGHIGFRLSVHSKLSSDDIELGFDADNVGLVETKPFGQYVVEHYPQKRGMTTYALALDSAQRFALVEDLNQYIKTGAGPYNLYFNNCAHYVIRVLNRVLDEMVTGLATTYPEKIPTLLKERNLVTRWTHEGGYKGAPVTSNPVPH